MYYRRRGPGCGCCLISLLLLPITILMQIFGGLLGYPYRRRWMGRRWGRGWGRGWGGGWRYM